MLLRFEATLCQTCCSRENFEEVKIFSHGSEILVNVMHIIILYSHPYFFIIFRTCSLALLSKDASDHGTCWAIAFLLLDSQTQESREKYRCALFL